MDLKWLKSSLLCLCSSSSGESQDGITVSAHRAAGGGGEERDEESKGGSPQRLLTVMHFRLKPDQIIRGEMADLVNSGSQWTHLRWRLILLSVSERKSFLLLLLALAVWISPNRYSTVIKQDKLDAFFLKLPFYQSSQYLLLLLPFVVIQFKYKCEMSPTVLHLLFPEVENDSQK